ncbi:MAG: cytochrome c oxidase accessory protein CcoG [Granulosicoccus sp.]|nr:cytochrome c oxidase accessory protein CcoG [Granulosicoccus sp.]
MSTSSAPGGIRQEQMLLEVRRKVYMRSVSGVFARWRWILVWFTQVLFYGLPWLNWNGRQAVLFDLAARKFHIFGLILYPQDFIYLTGLLIISAMSLFLFTTVAGRLWCGYACPQTVYTEIFMWIERRIEGDRARRMKLDAAGFSSRKLRLKVAKHAAWIAVALWTGLTFVGYFTPIRSMLGQLFSLSLGPWQTFWILFYGFATYGNAGFLREQVCKYMCPYARFQGVMFDRDTWIITYDPGRGEPRGARSRKSGSAGKGDCVDCSLCVQVCPTGIDIRDGQQYECIGCAACIDACDQVMQKVGSPQGLIRYDTLNGMEQGWSRAQLWRRVFRPRVLVYSVILLSVTGILFGHILTRTPVKVDVMRDRGALSREVKNGVIENVYQVMLINSAEFERSFDLSVQGLPGMRIDSERRVTVPGASNRVVAVRVRSEPDSGETGSNPVQFVVRAADDPTVVQTAKTSFFLPEQIQ